MIAIIDSGIGGKGIEQEIRKLLPKVRIIYFADKKNFPYGLKKPTYLRKILKEHVQTFIDKGAKIVVIACNSGSVSALKNLQAEFKTPIVGVVPIIKEASKMTKTKEIAVLATPVTVKSKVLNDLIKECCRGVKVYKIPCQKLARYIEDRDTEKIKKEVSELWGKYRNKNIDTVVLGCTHYTLDKKEIQGVIGSKVKIIDSNKEVAQKVKKIYDGLKQR